MTRKFAEDDANLDLGAIITSRSRKYSDLNLLFEPKPGSGDVYLSRDAAAVKQSVKNIVLTQFYEKPFNPRFGGNIRSMLFENITPFTAFQIREAIMNAVKNHEPRARVLEVSVRENAPNSVVVNLEFQVISTLERITLSVELERLR